MYSLTTLALVAAAAMLVGLLIGLLAGRRTSQDGQRYREVERKLDQVMQDKKAFEDDVGDHFADTAKLLNNLTESYRDVHNHLATGAASLCQGKGPVALGQLESEAADPTLIPEQMVDLQQPLDYAPKTSPDEKGMLNEEFGLDRQPNSVIQEDQPKTA